MEVKIENGHEIIDIVSDDFVCCLKVHRPIVANWPDCHGSVGQYYAVAAMNGEVTENLAQEISKVVIDGSDEEIFERMRKFLRLFSSGTYQISMQRGSIKEYELVSDDKPIGTWHPTKKQENSHSGYYPLHDSFVFSQSQSSINQERVNYYTDLIQRGMRPKPIVIHYGEVDKGTHPDGSPWIGCSDSQFFVIDGHHKLLAYTNLSIDPEFILIEKIPVGEHASLKQKENLYFQMEWFLDDYCKTHIICHTVQIYFGKDKREIAYNQYLDTYLKTNASVGIRILDKFLFAFEKNEPDYLKWLIERLESLRSKADGKNKYWLNFRTPNKTLWDGMHYVTLEDFDEWCMQMFGMTFERLKQKSLS